tara:strand:+ start:83 stop:301 length:219 start_codon:yes stop_codon:yes gene_type:complete
MKNCYYRHSFPVDEWGRLGGMYSLADVPVVAYKELKRKGRILREDTKKKEYIIRDVEKKFTKVVPFANVEFK